MSLSRMSALCLILLALGLTSGCKKRRSNHRHLVSTDIVTVDTVGDFYWQADVDLYFAVDEYEWENPFTDAQVEFEAIGLYGEFTIEIYDDFDFLVYERTFFGDGGYRYQFDLTEFGEPGIWFVRLTSYDVDGLLTVSLY